MRVLLVLFCVLLTQGSAFVPTLRTKDVDAVPSIVTSDSSSSRLAASKKFDRETIRTTTGGFDAIRANENAAAMAGLLSGFLSLVPRALAETEIEMAELPPPYIPGRVWSLSHCWSWAPDRKPW